MCEARAADRGGAARWTGKLPEHRPAFGGLSGIEQVLDDDGPPRAQRAPPQVGARRLGEARTHLDRTSAATVTLLGSMSALPGGRHHRHPVGGAQAERHDRAAGHAVLGDLGMIDDVVPDVTELRRRVQTMLEAHWVPEGCAAPNDRVYPWQWLWDSCFHSLIWAALGDDERALRELTTALATQDASGFVPHMNYVRDPAFHAGFWGRRGTSSITQPPMYGHVVAELGRRGVSVPDEVVDRARRGLEFLLHRRRRHPSGLVLLAHPWETGCDDSPRWDDVSGADAFDLSAWYVRKGELVASIEHDAAGAPIANRALTIASAGFNALVAFNARELGMDVTDADVAELVDALDARWDAGLATWVDAGETEQGSGRARTVDGLLGTLVSTDAAKLDAAFGAMVDPTAHGAMYGPTGVHRAEPTFAPSVYWRGPTWPQLSYLLWVAAGRAGRTDIAATIATATVGGADRSGLAEYWHPDTAEGLGAIPQSWTGLAILMTPPPPQPN
jgi:hypothetical protein